MRTRPMVRTYGLAFVAGVLAGAVTTLVWNLATAIFHNWIAAAVLTVSVVIVINVVRGRRLRRERSTT